MTQIIDELLELRVYINVVLIWGVTRVHMTSTKKMIPIRNNTSKVNYLTPVMTPCSLDGLISREV